MVLVVFSSKSSYGWGKKGHEIVADVASALLDDHARQAVQKYLGTIAFEQAGTWMDDMRSDHKFDFMRTWHYTNIEKGAAYVPNDKEDVINELKRVITELEHKDKMKDEDIKRDILVLFHLTGDLHQPLHVGYEEDQGGNKIQVSYLKKSSNLHRVWDTEIIESENITFNTVFQHYKSFDKEEIVGLKKIDVDNWMRLPRSQLARVYDFKDAEIDQNYVTRNKKVVEEDLLVAGIRLASVLQSVFGS